MIDIDNLTLGQIKQIKTIAGGCEPHDGAKLSKMVIGPERPVMITTEFRGVFFGYATDTSGDTVRLKRARNCIYWSSSEKGFLGLAVSGPGKSCKIGPAVTELELRKVTSVTECTAEAVKAWEAAPFAG